MGTKAIETNQLTHGLLGRIEQRNPQSQRYKNGCEELTGAEIRGGRVTAAPAIGGLRGYNFRAQFVPYPDGHFYLRNTAVSPDQELVPALTDDTGAVGARSFYDLLEGTLKAGGHQAYTGVAGETTGAYNKYAAPSPSSKVWATGNTTPIFVDRVIRYVRAFPFVNTATGLTEWGVVCKKKNHYNYGMRIAGVLAKTDSGNEDALIHGRGRLSVSKSGWSYHDLVVYEQDDVDTTIEPVIWTAKTGYFAANDNDLYLVGKMGMFSGAPSIRNYTYTHDGVTADTSTASPNVDGMGDVYVLFWGTPATVSGDADVAGKDVSWNGTAVPGATTAQFKFITPRTIVAGKRRFGAAMVIDVAAGQNKNYEDRNFYLGATALAAAKGDGASTNFGTGAAAPYVLRLDSQPVWYEQTYQGILVGTLTAEYLVTNHQDATQAAVQRVSSMGSRVLVDDRRAASTQLAGSVYFITNRGLGTVKFSNEAQSFIPAEIDLVAMGLGKPQSVGSSRSTGMVYVSTDTGNVVAINPLSGGVSSRTILTNNDGLNTYTFWGLDTVAGEPLLVWRYDTQVSSVLSTTWKESDFSTVAFESSVIRTTKFLALPEKRVVIKNVILNLVATFGGRVRVVNSKPEQWIELPLTADAIQYGFTGNLKIPVVDVQDNEGSGKGVEIMFYAAEKYELISVTVEGEVT